MRSKLQFVSFSLWIFVLLLFLTSLAISGNSDETIHRQFDVAPGGRLTVGSDIGSIEVNTSSGNTVDIEVIRKVRGLGDSEDALKDFEVHFDKSGNDVKVRGELKDHRNRSGLSIRYIITVPKKYNVDLNTAGGSISVANLEGEVLANTSGGSLHFGKVTGPVTGKTSGGSVSLDGCSGNADIRTSGGSISIGDVSGNVDAYTSGGSVSIEKAGGSVTARTSGGSINVDEVMGAIDAQTTGGSVTAHISRQPKGPCRLTTSGGTVTVYLADDIDLNIDASTSGGKVESDLPVTVQGSMKKNSMQGKINGGGPELYLRTSGGNILLKEM